MSGQRFDRFAAGQRHKGATILTGADQVCPSGVMAGYAPRRAGQMAWVRLE
jgi:hypothetical protein